MESGPLHNLFFYYQQAEKIIRGDKTMNNKNPGIREDGELDKMIRSISHWARRRIILLLGTRGPMTYSELMREVGIEDSGTFAFHLRSLGGLVEKTSDGRYKLTDRGREVYRALKILLGEKPVSEEQEKPIEQPSVSQPLIIGNMGKCYVTKEIIEEALRTNRKIIVQNCIKAVFDEDIEPDDLRKTLEKVEGVLVVEAPSGLHPIIGMRASKVITFIDKTGRRTEIPDIGRIVTETVTKALEGGIKAVEKIVTSIPLFTKKAREIKIMKQNPNQPYDLRLTFDSTAIMIYSGQNLALEGKAYSSEDPSIEANDSEIEASIDSFKGKLELPPGPLASIILHADYSSIKINIDKLQGPLEASIDNSVLSIKINETDRLIGTISADSSKIDLETEITSSGRNELKIDTDSTFIKIKVKVPKDMKVFLEQDADSSIIKTEGEIYYGKPSRDIENYLLIKLNCDSTVVSIIIDRK